MNRTVLWKLPLLALAVTWLSTASAYGGLPADDRLKSCEADIALAAARQIVDDPATLKEPLQLFMPAMVLFQNGRKDEAVFWFYAAQLRARYQLAFEKGDRGQLLSVMLMTVGPLINNYAFQDIGKLSRTIDQVLVWDKAAPNPFRERSQSREAADSVDKVYAGFRELKAKLLSERDELERQARQAAPQMAQMAEQMRSRQCRPGAPDPALASRTIEAEKKAVVSFARSHPDVVREAGAIRFADVGSYVQGSGASLPHRYTVSIDGTAKRVYAEVDVTRTGGNASYSLACITHLWLGQRQPFKDVCAR